MINVSLMSKVDSVDPGRRLYNEHDLLKDLELSVMLKAMSDGDELIYTACQETILSGVTVDDETRFYRHSVLNDCIGNSHIVGEIYRLAGQALSEARKHGFNGLGRSRFKQLQVSIVLLRLLLNMLEKLKDFTKPYETRFTSEGFKSFLSTLNSEFPDRYFRDARASLQRLNFEAGIGISAELGPGGTQRNYVLREIELGTMSRMRELLRRGPQSRNLYIDPEDETGQRELSELRDRSIKRCAIILARFVDRTLVFFRSLQFQLAFYLGCVNLYQALVRQNLPVSFPVLAPHPDHCFSCAGLYDICLALTIGNRIVSNDIDADGKQFILITGANEGGKSTFLRSVGTAQLMMQCGMFVAARRFHSSTCDHLFTHYRRREDVMMKSGKLDEELKRVSEMADYLSDESMVLLNESFSCTDETEGAELAKQIIDAFLEQGIRVFFVTHLYEFARLTYHRGGETTFSLVTERLGDGRRTFKLSPGAPSQTSYGEDLYKSLILPDGRRRNGARS